MATKQPHVLITGGAGYIGSVLTEHLLNAGCRVTVLDNLFFQQRSLFHLAAHPAFEFVFGDARDAALLKELLRDADAIIPLVAVVGAPACKRDPALARSLNVDTIRLLLGLKSPSQVVVFPATDSSYGSQPGIICTEDTPLAPLSLYAETKVESEREVLSSPNGVSLRLATVFGASPRMRLDLLVNHFVHTAVTDGALVVFEKDFRRQFVHVRDVADAFCFAIDNVGRMAGRAFNVGRDDSNVSKGELALRIKEHVPGLLVHFADVGTDPEGRNFVVSHARLNALGFEATKTLDFGIRELVKTYRMMRGHGLTRNA
ncbi:MAG: NAD(P)-dependent oxidoreductase [Candidatus Sungbacteria bacterium]|uniref:NAD(P)-dependent oxidoreductase n=1 Tax=Candidatus Sungiibacteriota bacterium TaxID=2750080 RepID=A0A933DTV8_9BACT|nr:NAD(P)-dependent oxidoreductase [Candidatus Sungbacteria bacterium]